MPKPDVVHSPRNVSVLLYSQGNPFLLRRALLSLRQMGGVNFEVIVVCQKGRASELLPGEFVGSLRFAKAPVATEFPGGEAILEMYDDWFCNRRDWFSGLLENLKGVEAVTVPVLPSWSLFSRKPQKVTELARCVLWSRAAWLRGRYTLDGPSPLPEGLGPLAHLEDFPLFERGADALDIEMPLQSSGLRVTASRVVRSMARTPLYRWPQKAAHKLGSKLPHKKNSDVRENSESAQEFILDIRQPEEDFVPFPTKAAKDAECVAISSRTLPPQPFAGGIGQYTMELSQRLEEQGLKVHMLTLGQGEVQVEGPGLRRHPVVPPSMAPRFEREDLAEINAQRSAALYRKIIELALCGEDIKLVEAPNWDAEGFVQSWASGPPLAVRVHTPRKVVMETENWDVDAGQLRNVEMEKLLVQRAEGLYASTGKMAELVAEDIGSDLLASKNFTFIKSQFDIAPPPVKAFKNNAFHVLFVGRLESRKGLDALLETIPAILQEKPDVVFDLVGDDSIPHENSTYRAEFERSYAKKDWFQRCRFHGQVDQNTLLRFYKSCDLFVAPSLFESLGLIYLEAMRESKPVIGCLVGGVPEVVINGETGILIEPDNALQLWEAIDRLYFDGQLRSEMGRAGRARLEKIFDGRRTSRQTLEFYRRFMKNDFTPEGRLWTPDMEDVEFDDWPIQWRDDGPPAWVALRRKALRIPACGGWTEFTFECGPDCGGVRIVSPDGGKAELDLWMEQSSGRRSVLFELPQDWNKGDFVLYNQYNRSKRKNGRVFLLKILNTPVPGWPGKLPVLKCGN